MWNEFYMSSDLDDFINSDPFLTPEEKDSSQRTQARRKLAALTQTRLADLCGEVYFEIQRRFPGLKQPEMVRLFFVLLRSAPTTSTLALRRRPKRHLTQGGTRRQVLRGRRCRACSRGDQGGRPLDFPCDDITSSVRCPVDNSHCAIPPISVLNTSRSVRRRSGPFLL